MPTDIGQKTIVVVSDSTGKTGMLLLSRLLVQFRGLAQPQVKLKGGVRTEEQLAEIVEEVRAWGSRALLFGTIVDPELNRRFGEMGLTSGVKCINALSSLLFELSDFFAQEPSGAPGGGEEKSPVKQVDIVDTEFLSSVKAMQFVQQHLSGLNRADWSQADVVLIGLSRAGKVSIAFYLAQRGVKAACVDCGPDQPLPAELSRLGPGKVVVIQQQPEALARRRRNRVLELQAKGLPRLLEPEYADLGQIEKEASYLSGLVASNPQWLGPVDGTYLALEESGSVVMRLIGWGSDRQA